MSSHSAHHEAHLSPNTTDPVCGMDVDPTTSGHTVRHDGESFFFCSAGCAATFEADPDRYSGPDRAPGQSPGGTAGPGPGGEVAEYTCPMHPEIRQDGAGSCPLCGMALEPVLVTAETGPNAELVDMTRRFWVSLALSIPVVILSMGRDLVPALRDLVDAQVSVWAQLVLATPVVLWAGAPFFVRGWASVRTRNLNMFTLIA
ncbi:heavy metal-binding domain-containing protein, partial [Streptomyces rhizosphaericus]